MSGANDGGADDGRAGRGRSCAALDGGGSRRSGGGSATNATKDGRRRRRRRNFSGRRRIARGGSASYSDSGDAAGAGSLFCGAVTATTAVAAAAATSYRSGLCTSGGANTAGRDRVVEVGVAARDGGGSGLAGLRGRSCGLLALSAGGTGSCSVGSTSGSRGSSKARLERCARASGRCGRLEDGSVLRSAVLVTSTNDLDGLERASLVLPVVLGAGGVVDDLDAGNGHVEGRLGVVDLAASPLNGTLVLRVTARPVAKANVARSLREVLTAVRIGIVQSALGFAVDQPGERL